MLQELELDMEQQTGSKWEKEYIKAVYCHPAYLTDMHCLLSPWDSPGKYTGVGCHFLFQ